MMNPLKQQSKPAAVVQSAVRQPATSEAVLLQEVRTLQEVVAFGRVQSCWRAERDSVKLEELDDGRVRMTFTGSGLREGLPTVLVLGSANIAYTFPA